MIIVITITSTSIIISIIIIVVVVVVVVIVIVIVTVDIIMVAWLACRFDSGSSWAGVLSREGLALPADLYLEGSDQHRGQAQLFLTPNHVSDFRNVIPTLEIKYTLEIK